MQIKDLTLAALFAALTSILSVVAIPLPFTPVPITLQVFAVTISGAILGRKLGFLSQLTYVLLGGIGLPVFAGGNAGFGVLVGPTGGYLWGFVAAGFIIGLVVEVGSKKVSTSLHKYLVLFLAMVAGLAVIYTFGVIQLMIVANLSLSAAITQGLVPFILPGILKVLVGSSLAFPIRERLVSANLITYQQAL